MTQFDPKAHTITLTRSQKQADGSRKTVSTEYLPVMWRLYWFRQENPKGVIESRMVHLDLERNAAVFEVTVAAESGAVAKMHGSETAADWKDYIEKAETKGLGRALAAVGFGSQFADDDFDEGERLADTPAERKVQTPTTPVTPAPAAQAASSNGELAITDQQRASVTKLCQHLGKPEPVASGMTYEAARTLIAQLSAEYRTRHQKKSA